MCTKDQVRQAAVLWLHAFDFGATCAWQDCRHELFEMCRLLTLTKRLSNLSEFACKDMTSLYSSYL